MHCSDNANPYWDRIESSQNANRSRLYRPGAETDLTPMGCGVSENDKPGL